MPARFLDLGSNNNISSIKLVSSHKLGKHPSTQRYIALSHCWGSPSKAIPKTTKANIDDHLRGIPIDTLPRTFRDSILVAKALGICFLWIDSLCIIQDDDADWATEAAKMADVYQGSYLTIAATSAQNSDGGLYLDSLAPAIRLTVSSGRDAAGTASPAPISCSLRDQLGSAETIWAAALSQRAWTFQEQVLAPRLIHFTKHQMFYQCSLGLESEDGTISIRGFESLRWAAVRSEKSPLMGDLTKPWNATITWWAWVEEYTSRSLTFSHDRIAAFAGVLNYFQRKTGREPVLGLWKETLWYDLAWHIQHGSIMPNEEAHVISSIPTWSWLSIRPSVQIECLEKDLDEATCDEDMKLKLVSFSIQWDGTAYTSEIKSVDLVVISLVKPFGTKLDTSTVTQTFHATWDEDLSFTIFLDGVQSSQSYTGLILLYLYSSAPGFPHSHEYFLLLCPEGEGPWPRYNRLGSGSVKSPASHEGFFNDSSITQIALA